MRFRVILEVRHETGSLHRHQSESFHAVTVGELLSQSGKALWEALGMFARFQGKTSNDLKVNELDGG